MTILDLARKVIGALAVGATLGLSPLAAVAQDDPPIVAAAADLRYAVTEIAAAFQAETGMDVTLTFGSTGNFARQIREGAPFQIYLAADESYVAALHRDGFTRNGGDLYAEGRIVLMVPHGSALVPDETFDNLAAMLAAGTLTRFAIANPDHAPYGGRAKEALIHRGLWDAIQPVLVQGENVSQTAQFALSGDAEGGIIAYSLALAPEVSVQGDFVLIPQDWHQPLLQRMVLLNHAGPVAEAFYGYMSTPAARAIMARYGFARTGE
ncbi:MAG: molybdate ABC transporter substrate-binding protein [Pseudorhodobacter sp.]|nr:molybdate ABC transporter substrate-binding protein [Pseudorhodobacter sp.]